MVFSFLKEGTVKNSNTILPVFLELNYWFFIGRVYKSGAFNDLVIETVRRDLKASLTIETLKRNEVSQVNMSMFFNIGFGKVVFQASGMDQDMNYYLNGQKMSEAEVRAIFGDVASGTEL